MHTKQHITKNKDNIRCNSLTALRLRWYQKLRSVFLYTRVVLLSCGMFRVCPQNRVTAYTGPQPHSWHFLCRMSRMSYLWTASCSSLINIQANMSFDKISINTQLSLKSLLNLNATWQYGVGNTNQWCHDFHENCESLKILPRNVLSQFAWRNCVTIHIHRLPEIQYAFK